MHIGTKSGLKELDLSNTLISNEGAELLAQLLTKNLVLNKLDIMNTQITDKGISTIAKIASAKGHRVQEFKFNL